MKRIPKIVYLEGRFLDEQGTALRGKITGYNGNGIPCRRYTWIAPKVPGRKRQTFEAFDTQIIPALSSYT